jgi:cytochrome c oxidase subunit 2
MHEPYDRVTSVNASHYADRFFQRPATEVMSNIIDFHNDLMVVLIFISVFIVVILTICLYNYATYSVHDFYLIDTPVSRMNHNAVAEITFTAIPAMIVYLIAAPSFSLLYSSNDWLEKEADLTVSVTGHQWY